MSDLLGLRVEYCPDALPVGYGRASDGTQYFGEAAVDIIAVQGLGSNYDWTWSVAAEATGQRYHWLRQSIRSELPHARVLAFDYDSRWYDNPASVSLEECGAQLLRAVLADRGHAESTRMCPTSSQRPIIFIGHSFGGLVIKQGLVLASQTGTSNPLYDDHRAFLMATTSILFLGTPHRGSAFPSLARLKLMAGNVLGTRTEERLLRVLNVDSELLLYLQNEFERVQQNLSDEPIQLYCYYEKKDVRVGPFRAGKVVSEMSACLDGAEKRGMDADHVGMNKFGPGDRRYEDTVKPDLLLSYQRAFRNATVRFAAHEYGSEWANPELQRLHSILAPLTASQRDRHDFHYQEHQRTIRPGGRASTSTSTSTSTCTWIHRLETFNHWRTALDFSCLWIHGKSGSGKSVLAAYITKFLQPAGHAHIYTQQAHEQRLVCLSPISSPVCVDNAVSSASVYFICGVDPAMESPARMMATLIHQLLVRSGRNWKLQALCLSALRKLQHGDSATELAKLLAELASIIGQVFVVVDGLDENRDYRECINVLANLSTSKHIHLIVCSRDIYDVEQQLRRSFTSALLDVDITAHSKPDIDSFVEHEAAELIRLKPQIALNHQFIVHELKQRADGVFQWVKSALRHLDTTCVSPHDVVESLNSFHHGIFATYDSIVQHLRLTKAAAYERKRIRAALMWLCVAGRTLSPSELLTLAILGDDFDAISLHKMERAHSSNVAAAEALRALLESSIEIIHLDNGDLGVKLIHSSFKDFLTDPGQLPHVGFTLAAAEMHCARVTMAICTVSCRRLSQRSHVVGQDALLDYAWRFWAYHFNLSGLGLDNAQMAASFAVLLRTTSAESLSFLATLGISLCQRHDLGAVPKKERLHFVRAFQQAQQALFSLMRDMTALRTNLPVARRLQNCRDLYLEAESGGAPPYAGLVDQAYGLVSTCRPKPSRISTLNVDGLLRRKMRKLSREEDQLATIARQLRLVIAAIAIHPVYEEITANQRGVAPLTILAHVSNYMESIASFAYWTQVPPTSDPLGVFKTDSDDKYGLHAQAVLRRLALTEGEAAPMDSPPGWNTAAAAFFSTTQAGLRDLQRNINPADEGRSPNMGMSASQWYAANLSFNLLYSTRGPLSQTLISNPLAYLHMRHGMYIDEKASRMFAAPWTTLMRHVPTEITQRPLGTFVAALPVMLATYFIHFIRQVLHSLHKFAWPFVVLQWGRIQMAGQLLHSSSTFLSWGVKGNMAKPKLVHLVFGLLFYCVRWKYWPWFGAHSAPYPFRDVANALLDPLQFIVDNAHDWWWWAGYIFRLHGGSAVFVVANEFDGTSPLDLVATSFTCFWMFCAFERGICQAVNATCQVLSIVSLMFQDRETLKELVKFCSQYWFRVAMTLFNQGVAIQSIAMFGPWSLAFIAGSVVFLTWFFQSDYEAQMLNSVWEAAHPFCASLWGSVKVAVAFPEFPIWRVIGSISWAAAIFVAAAWFVGFCGDPFDLHGTRARLQRAVCRAEDSLRGWRPVGAVEFNKGQTDNLGQGGGNTSTLGPQEITGELSGVRVDEGQVGWRHGESPAQSSRAQPQIPIHDHHPMTSQVRLVPNSEVRSRRSLRSNRQLVGSASG